MPMTNLWMDSESGLPKVPNVPSLTSSRMAHSDDFDEIRPVANIQELEAVYRLTHECYVSSSYAPPNANGLLLHYPEFDVIPETTVLVAIHAGEIVGSVSATVASANGLTVGHDFPEACRQMEKEGRALAAVWRLVVKDSHRNSRHVLIGLISEVTRRLLTSSMDTFLFVVNPKHARIYQRLLNMTVVAEKPATDGLHNAAAVLLRGDRETLPEQWRLAGLSVRSSDPIGLFGLEPFLELVSIPEEAA